MPYYEDCIYCEEEEPEMCPLHGLDNEEEMVSQDEHNIDGAFYSNGPDGLYPTLQCSCGFGARECNWEEAGYTYDSHLRAEDESGIGAAG